MSKWSWIVGVLMVMAGCGGRGAGPQMQQGVQQGALSGVVHPTDVFFLGDLDGDAAASVGDAIKVLRIVVGLDTDDPRADANRNGGTDVGDAIQLLRCVVGLDAWPIAMGVDSDGGMVTAAGGAVELDFPAGAVSQDFVPEVVVTTAYPPDSAIVPETAYEFRPAGTQFAQPVEITIVYDPAKVPIGVNEDDLHLCKVVGDAWEKVAGSSVDMAAHTVTGATSSFSIYAAGAKGAPSGYIFVTAWGSEGNGDGQFDLPHGVAVDAAANVYVTDLHNDRIQKFTSDGLYLTKWGFSGWWQGQFQGPWDVAADAAGDVYVADTFNSRIQKFTSYGDFLTEWGSAGAVGDGRFNRPLSVTVDSTGNVYVADTNNHRIQKFTKGGTFLGWWGRDTDGSTGWHGPGSDKTPTWGSENGQLLRPYGVAADGKGNVYVADTENDRIQKFTSTGTFLTMWGSKGRSEGEFDYPEGVAVDSAGDVYVADRVNHRIQKFTAEGVFLGWWGRGLRWDTGQGQWVDATSGWHDPGSRESPAEGSGQGQFNWPRRVAVDSAGNVYVADTYNNRIQEFRPMAP